MDASYNIFPTDKMDDAKACRADQEMSVIADKRRLEKENDDIKIFTPSWLDSLAIKNWSQTRPSRKAIVSLDLELLVLASVQYNTGRRED